MADNYADCVECGRLDYIGDGGLCNDCQEFVDNYAKLMSEPIVTYHEQVLEKSTPETFEADIAKLKQRHAENEAHDHILNELMCYSDRATRAEELLQTTLNDLNTATDMQDVALIRQQLASYLQEVG